MKYEFAFTLRKARKEGLKLFQARKPKTAIFWDADNIPITVIGKKELLAKEITSIPRLSGDVIVFRVYGSNLEKNKDKQIELQKMGANFIPISPGREFSLDNRLISDCIKYHTEHPEIEHYFIVSGDGGYLNLAKVLMQLGKKVIVHGIKQRTSEKLRKTVHHYFPIII